MTLLFLESFDDSLYPYKYAVNPNIDSGISSPGRTGPYAFTQISNQSIVLGQNRSFVFNTGDRAAQMFTGVAFQTNDITLEHMVVHFNDSILGVVVNNGLIEIRTNFTTVLATGTTVLSSDTWYYIEFSLFWNASGTAEVYLNGNLEVSWSGDTTMSSGIPDIQNIFWSRPGFGGGGNNQVAIHDDVYVCNDQGSYNNTRLGDITVSAIFPDADGGDLDWVPDTGTTHYDRVNENPPDDDASYVLGSVDGDKDNYSFDPINASGGVAGLVVRTWARTVGAGSRSLRHIATLDASEVSGDTLALGASYSMQSTIMETDPTGAIWTETTVNDTDFGQEVQP